MLRTAFIFALALLVASPGRAATIHVPGDQPTIQAGIDAAAAGDTVLVGPGSYSGLGNRDIQFRGLDIVVASTAGASATSIDCESLGRAFLIDSGESRETVLEGFTIRNGAANGGGGIRCRNASPTIRLCVIEDCATGGVNGGGIDARETSLAITDCTLTRNSTTGNGGAIYVGVSTGAEVVRCTLVANHASLRGGGIEFKGGIDCSMRGCLIQGNVGGGLSVWDATLDVSECTVTGNRYEYPAWGVGGGIGVRVFSTLTVERSIVWGNCSIPYADEIVVGGVFSTASFSCSVVNTGPGTILGAITFDDHCLFVPPQFCEPALCRLAPDSGGNSFLAPSSPCLPGNSPCGELIGALPVGCGPVSVVEESWARIKGRYR